MRSHILSIWKEFKEFSVKGNAVDLAIGVIIGAAFGKIVDSLVNDLLMPVLSLIIGRVDFSSLKIHLTSHISINYGNFLNVVINFLIISFAIFMMVKQINRFRSKSSPSNKECQYCKTTIPIAATRCPACTSQLN